MAIQNTIIDKKEITAIIKNTIKESIKEEFFKIRLDLIPLISDEEMLEIAKKYKKPDKNIVRTEWIEI